MHASSVENVLTYCLKNSACRHEDRSTFITACEALPFETLAQALSASQLTGLFVSALDELELISPKVAAIRARLEPEMIIRNRFNISLLRELTRLCDRKPQHLQTIMLGGPDMWADIYPDPLERHSEDLDLLFCSEESFSGVVSVAIDLGYCRMKSESLSLDYGQGSSQHPTLSSSLYYVDRELELNTQEAAAYRQLRSNDLNTYSIAEVTPGRFVITHFLELHKLSPADFGNQFSAQCQRYVRPSRFSESIYQLDTAAQIVFTAFKYREKIEQGGFSNRVDSKRLKSIGDFIRLIGTADCEHIVHAKLVAEQCGLSNPLADLLASVLRINPALPIGALENIIARRGGGVIKQAVASCARMLSDTHAGMSGPLPPVHQNAKVAVSHMS